MIQTYNQLQLKVNEFHLFNETLKEGQCGKIQKIWSTPHFICLGVRYPGVNKYLYLGRGSGYEGFWEFKSYPPAFSRVRDTYLEYLRKHLVGALLFNIEIDRGDRIIFLRLLKRGVHAEFGLFWEGRNFHFSRVTEEEEKLEAFVSWERGSQDLTCDKNIREWGEYFFEQKGRKKINLDREKKEQGDIESYFQKLEKKITTPHLKKRKRKYFLNKIKKIEQDLLKVSKWEDLQKILMKEDFEVPNEDEIKICNIKIKLKRDWNSYQRRDFLFLKVKSFRKAQKILEGRLLKTQSDYKAWESGEIVQRDISEVKINSPVWPVREKTKKKSTVIGGYSVVEFTFSSGIRAGFGKDTHSNDYLRNEWGKKTDLWFHLEGQKSGHLIVKVDDVSKLSDEDFSVIASALRDSVGVQDLDIALVYTWVKNLRGLKGKAGAVLYKKEKYRKVFYLENWREKVAFS